MDVAADGERLARPQDYFPEHVAEIHHIEERKTSVDPRCGQNLKESTVFVVVRVAIAGPIITTSAEPGTEPGQHRRLPPHLGREGARALCELTPGTGLQGTPCQEIQCAGRRESGLQIVAAVRADVDTACIGCADS